MKKEFIAIAILLVFLISYAPSFASASTSEVVNYTSISIAKDIQVTKLKYEPYPVNPGEYFDLWIEATIGSDATNATFKLDPKYPFSIDASDNPIRSFGSVPTTVIFHYKVRVSQDAVEGDNQLDLEYSNDGIHFANVKTFDIQVANAQTNFDLVIQDYSDSQISLAIANIGENTANSLIVRIPEQPNYAVTGTNGQMVGNLNSGDYTIVSFDVAKTGRGGYSQNSSDLQVQLDYTDSIGVRRSVIKDVQFISNSPIAARNITRSSSGSGSFQFQRSSSSGQQSSSTSIFKSYWFWIVVILIAAALFYYYKKNPDKVKQFFSRTKTKGDKKNSKDAPDWVLAEKTKKR